MHKQISEQHVYLKGKVHLKMQIDILMALMLFSNPYEIIPWNILKNLNNVVVALFHLVTKND